MHFGHNNILRFDNRPFESSAEMDEALIERWNRKVQPEDAVYVIGDAFWKNEEDSISIMKRLNGKKFLIKGNHDRIHGRLGNEWVSVNDILEIVDCYRRVVMCHYPMMFYNGQHNGAYMLYGHVHNSREWLLVEKWRKELACNQIPNKIINVGCMLDYMNYEPRTLDELIDANSMAEMGGDIK